MICDRCRTVVLIGDWPFCPHGRGTYTAIPDDIPGGLVIENLGPDPITVYSHTQRRRIMCDRGLREVVTDGGHALCETSLTNARSLLDPGRRGVPPAGGDREPVVGAEEVETLTLTVTELDTTFSIKPEP